MAVLSETIALNVASRRHRVKRRHDYTETVSWKATSSSKFIFVCRTTQLKQISLLPDVHWMERSSVSRGRQPSFHKCGGVTQVIVFSRRRLSSCCVLDHRLGGPFSLVNRCFEPGASTTWLGTGSLLTSRMLAKRQPSGGRPRFRLTTRCRRPCEKKQTNKISSSALLAAGGQPILRLSAPHRAQPCSAESAVFIRNGAWRAWRTRK